MIIEEIKEWIQSFRKDCTVKTDPSLDVIQYNQGISHALDELEDLLLNIELETKK